MNPLVLIFCALAAVSFAILFICSMPTCNSKSTLKRLSSIQESMRPHVTGIDGTELARVKSGEFGSRLGYFLNRYRFAQRLDVLLLHADSNMGVGRVVLVSAGSALVCGLAGVAFLLPWLVVAAITLAGAVAPTVLFRFKRNRRLKAFNAALPDAIDLMSRSLIAGHSVGSSIELVADQSPEPLAFEFVQVYQQQRLGVHFRDALLQMGTRIPSRDLQFFITAILVQKETGGDLTEILERASHVIRERIRIQGEIRTHTAQGRMTGWILALLPVVLLALINLANPGYSSILFHDPVGHKMLYSGAALILCGGLTIRKIVNVEF